MSRRIQLPTNKQAKSRLTDPSTSRQAAARIASQSLVTSQYAIFRVLKKLGQLSDADIYEEVSKTINISPSGARTRRKELVDAGLVRDSGQRGNTKAGNKTILWELVPGAPEPGVRALGGDDGTDRGGNESATVAGGQGRILRGIRRGGHLEGGG